MIEQSERELYKQLWNQGYTKSQCAVPLAVYIKKNVPVGKRILEIGSGDGTTVSLLSEAGYDITGSDIYSTHEMIIEAPAWELPFPDESFDLVVSTDVMEHLPTEKVDEAIKEIYRVTREKVIHVIACWLDMRNGEVVHKTVRPIEWWQQKFAPPVSTKEAVILDRDRFL